MDIQGGELMALHGASQLLKTRSIDLIYCEVVFVEQYVNQADFHQICRFWPIESLPCMDCIT